MMDKALLYKILANNTGAEISASGNPITLSGTLADNPLKDCKIYGWSKQDGTTGAQLLDLRESDIRPNTGLTATLQDGALTVSGTPAAAYVQIISKEIHLEPGIYYVSGGKKESGYIYSQVNIKRSDGTWNYLSGVPIYIDGTEQVINYVIQALNTGAAIENYTIYPMLNAGNTALPWEPYTGGQPSPNPEYPQDIVSAGMKWSTGAQLYDMDTRLNVEGTEYEKNGTSYTVNIVKASGNLLFGIPFQFSENDVDATVSVSGFSNLTMVGGRIDLLDSKNNVVGTLNADRTEKKLSAKCSQIRFNWSNGGKFIVSDLMLNFGNTALPYEPYTGGVPKLYGDKINVTVHGKNLFDLEYATKRRNWTLESNGYYYIPYYVGKGNAVSVTYGTDIPEGLGAYICINKYAGKTDSAYTWLYHSTISKLIINRVSFVSVSDYIYLNATGTYLDVIKKYMADLQIEVSTSPTSYEPYHKPQSLSIQTPNGLLGIPVTTGGNYTDANGQQWIADCIDLKRGKYVQNITTLELDGDEKFRYESGSDTQNILDGLYTVGFARNGTINKTVISNAFTRTTNNWTSQIKYVNEKKVSVFTLTNANWIFFVLDATTFPTKEDFATFLKTKKESGNPVVLYYNLGEPIERDLTSEEIQAYQNLATYAGITIVENDAKCYMEVSVGGGDALRAKKLALLLGD